MRVASMYLLLVLAWFLIDRLPGSGQAAHSVRTDVFDALCGSSSAAIPRVDDPVTPPGNGHVCGANVACTSCFYAAGYCRSCTKEKSFMICKVGTGTCLNESYTVDCGRVLRHQTATSSDECGTCIGTGGSPVSPCEKNSCQATLTDP